MKKLKSLAPACAIALTLLFSSIALNSYAQEAVTLPEVGISCVQESHYFGDEAMGWMVELLITVCDNGEVYHDFIFH